MNETQKLKGWMMLVYALFLGPFFLSLYFRVTRNAYPAARYFAWFSLLAMAICAYLMFSFSVSPFITRIGYIVAILSIFGLLFFYCWGLDAKIKTQTPGPKQAYSFTRACAWMVVMGILFFGLNNIVQAIYYWMIGEYVTVYFSSQANTFRFWILIGLIYGFAYGIKKNNDYFDRNISTVIRSVFSILFFIFLYNGLFLALIIYPSQRLSPISYSPQATEYIFYVLTFITISLSAIFLLRTLAPMGWFRAGILYVVGIPLMAIHLIVVSAYAVTINLTVACYLEDMQKIDSAKALYAKAIPYIRHDNLLASLHHRQGVLHVLNRDYESAIDSFKKVLADYSENYEVFGKADKYITAFEKNQSMEVPKRKILAVKHRTFEQAASCFPNSLSVILNFYERQPVSTRKLSYAIKESFAQGTFIWKAESFLEKNGYELLTTFWQDTETLISLLEAGYPVLVFIPGHVYTLYGYDLRMEMFFTYDTAKSNRWDDKPFWNFQRDWMKGSFLMSVVVPKGEKQTMAARFPQFNRYGSIYREWQKSHISDYYESRGNYWKDYDRYALSKSFGLDRLKMDEPYYLSEDFFHLPWNAAEWEREVLPVLSQPWALEWSIVENYILYLIYSEKSEQALQLIEQYESRLPSEPKRPFFPFFRYPSFFPSEPNTVLFHLMELKLAATAKADMKNEILSVSDKLIGITANISSESYWGHYFKARHLMASNDLKGAAEVLLSALNNVRFGRYPYTRSFSYILDALDEIAVVEPSLINPDKKPLIEMARIDLASD